MSATVSDRSRRRSRHDQPATSAWLRATASAIVAALCAAAGLAIAQAYPIWPLLALVLFAGWAVVAAMRPPWALAGLLALLPVIDFAPHTGWIIVEEFDLLVLATAAGGYAARAIAAWRADARSREDLRFRPRLTIASVAVILVYLAATIVSTERGIAIAGGFHFEWTQNYNGPLNSVRELKGLAWSLLLLPLMLTEIRSERGLQVIGRGITIALALCALAVIQERFAFTGLADFSQDYRVTGPFWEMHVGGATLDAFLVIAIPFAIREALHARRVEEFVGVTAVLVAAAYATLVTFSRGLYLAMPTGLVVLAVLLVISKRRQGGPSHWPQLVRGTLLAIGVAAASAAMFRHGGYRALLATLVVFALALRATVPMRFATASTWCIAAVVASVAGVVGYAGAAALPKGPYVVFAVATAVCIGTLLLARRRVTDTRALAVCCAWLWLVTAACVVAGGWGGRAAAIDSGAVMGSFVVVFVTTSRMQVSPWPTNERSQWSVIALVLTIMAVIATLSAGAYMGSRLSAGRGDLQARVAQWKEGLDRMRNAGDWLLGMGLGTYPETSLFAATQMAAAGDFRMLHRKGETFLALSAPPFAQLGFGSMLRLTQTVSIRPNTRYIASIVGRSATGAGVNIEVCEKHLIYSALCTYPTTSFPADAVQWTTRIVNVDVPNVNAGPLLAYKPLVFSIAVGSPGATLELRSLRLIGPGGVDVLRNGNFTEGTTRWFSSSDTNQGPYHISSLPIGVLFDQGVVGLTLLALLMIAALVRTTVGRAHRHPDAPFIAAALCAVFVLGLFDNLIDAPRIAFLFYVVVLLGLVLRNPGVGLVPRDTVVARAPPPPAAPPPPPAAASPDAAAERARRRQQAFGTRKRPDA